MILSDFLGNNNLKTTLSFLLKNKRLSSAILFYGEKGLGKSTISNIISKYLVCENSNFLSCECKHCKKAEIKVHPDIIYPDKSTTLNTYSISTVREIKISSYVKPNEAKNKVYILTDIDNMGVPAQNAFLKILEEPPKNVFFVLTCQSLSNILKTVQSRVIKFELAPLEKILVKNFLLKNKQFCVLNEEEKENILNFCGGNLGKILYLLENNYQSIFTIAKNLLESTIRKNEFDLLVLFSDPAFNKENINFTFDFLINFFENALVNSFKRTLNLDLSNRHLYEQSVLIKAIELFSDCKLKLRHNLNQSLLCSYLCSSLCSF